MFATSNNDKNIRIRALHDGKLLTKIPVSESISSLYFILDDNYLIQLHKYLQEMKKQRK